jgi:hypothetical protein
VKTPDDGQSRSKYIVGVEEKWKRNCYILAITLMCIEFEKRFDRSREGNENPQEQIQFLRLELFPPKHGVLNTPLRHCFGMLYSFHDFNMMHICLIKAMNRRDNTLHTFFANSLTSTFRVWMRPILYDWYGNEHVKNVMKFNLCFM